MPIPRSLSIEHRHLLADEVEKITRLPTKTEQDVAAWYVASEEAQKRLNAAFPDLAAVIPHGLYHYFSMRTSISTTLHIGLRRRRQLWTLFDASERRLRRVNRPRPNSSLQATAGRSDASHYIYENIPISIPASSRQRSLSLCLVRS
jgi:hypothetical protein